VWFLSKVRAPNDNASKTVYPQDTSEPERQGRQTVSGGSLVFHPPIDSSKSDNSSKHETPSWEKAAVVVAIALLLVNWFQGCQTKKAAGAAQSAAKTASDALKSSREQFRIDERPYITTETYGAWFVGDKKYVFSQQKNGDIDVSVAVNMNNVGRTPAENVVAIRTYFITGASEEATNKAKSYVPQYPESSQGTFLSPNNPAVVPTTQNFSMNKKMWEQFKHSEFTIYAVGGITYKDLFAPPLEKPYETVYCSQILPPPSLPIASCNFTNSIK
jgi:hypothetical protein